MAFCWWWRILCLTRKVKKNGVRELNTVLTSESKMGEVDANATGFGTNPEAGIWMSLFLLVWVFFFFFLHCFCNKSGNSGEKDCNLFVSSYHPDSKMDWITGVWFLIMQGSAKQGQESTDKMSKQKQECNTKNWNIKNNNKKSCVWKRAIMSQLAGAARCRCVNSAKDNVSPARLQAQWWAVGPGRD